jgi:hypothetical protein
MRRVLAPLLVLVAVGFMCGEATRSAPKAQSVVGSGDFAGNFVTFDGRVDRTGEVTGHFEGRSAPDAGSPFVVVGTVMCVNVVGDRASIGGELQEFFFEDWPDPGKWHGWSFVVQDKDGRMGAPDRVSTEYISEEPVTTCPDPTKDPLNYALTGDVVVSTEP